MAQSNISPLALELPEALVSDFDAFDDAIVSVTGYGRAFADTAAASGIRFDFTSRPNKDSSAEHRFGYALWVRLCIRKAAMMLGVSESEFEPVYSGAVKAGETVEIGRVPTLGPNGDVIGWTVGEVKTVTAWKGYVANAGRPVRSYMERVVRDDLAEAKAELFYAKAALDAAKAKSSVSVEALNAAQAVSAKAEAEAAKAEAEAEAAPRGAKAAAKAKAAKLRAKADNLVAETAALVDAVDDDAEVELASMAEVKAEEARVAALQAMLPDTGRGAAVAKTDAEKWAARLDALLKDVRAASSPTGDVDAVALVEALVTARGCIKTDAVIE